MEGMLGGVRDGSMEEKKDRKSIVRDDVVEKVFLYNERAGKKNVRVAKKKKQH